MMVLPDVMTLPHWRWTWKLRIEMKTPSDDKRSGIGPHDSISPLLLGGV